MVATVRCEEIANEKLMELVNNEVLDYQYVTIDIDEFSYS
jgi:hypothetical protein